MKKVFLKFRKIHKKTPVLESYVFEFFKISNNTFFHRTPPVAASENALDYYDVYYTAARSF